MGKWMDGWASGWMSEMDEWMDKQCLCLHANGNILSRVSSVPSEILEHAYRICECYGCPGEHYFGYSLSVPCQIHPWTTSYLCNMYI